jgi:hypothetical protein
MTEGSRLLRGAALELSTVREWPGVVLRRDPIVLTFPGTSALGRSSPVHLTFRVTGVDGPAEGGLLVFLGAAAIDAVPRDHGYVGAVAFFAHAGHALAPYRLPLAPTLGRLGGEALTITFIPTGGHPLEVTATIALVRSTVSR